MLFHAMARHLSQNEHVDNLAEMFRHCYVILQEYQLGISLILHPGNILLKPKSISFRWLLSLDSYLSAGTQHLCERRTGAV